jgi:phosphate transport system substrate-binding protein
MQRVLLNHKFIFLQRHLSDIVSGKITMWNDPAIKAENNKTTSQTTIVYKKDKKGAIVLDKKTKKPVVLSKQTETSDVVKLPAETIRVIYRADIFWNDLEFNELLSDSVP